MKRIGFNNTDLVVSELCLGTANFGTGRSEAESFGQMDLFMEKGGNFIDTALVYGDWGCDEPGRSEKVIGRWLSERRNRDQVVLSTKGCHPPAFDMSIPRVSGAEIRSDVEKSLRNLRTDYIDLYFLHRDNPAVPVAELLETLEEEVKKGNLRYYGCSNWTLERVKEAADYARAHGLQGFSCNQIMMALTDVDMTSIQWTQMQILDADFYQYHKESGLNLMAFQCMSGGYFAKKLALRKQARDAAGLSAERKNVISDGQKAMYDCPANEAILDELERFEKDSWDPVAFLLRYVTGAAFPAVPIAAFSSEEQLSRAILSLEKPVPAEMLCELTAHKKTQKYIW